MADAAEQWVTVATRSHGGASQRARARSHGAGRAVPAPGRHRRAGSSGCRSASAPAAATELTLYRHENARRDRRAADRGGRRGPGRRRLVRRHAAGRVLRAAHGRLQSRLARRRQARSGAVARRRMVARRHGAHVAHRARPPRWQSRLRRVLRLLHRPIPRRRRRLVGRAARRGRRQRAQRVGTGAGAPLDRRVDCGVRRARSTRGVHVAARLPARYAVAGDVSRRSSRGWACSRSRARPERTPISARTCSASSRGLVLGVGIAQLVPIAWLKQPRVQRLCGAAAVLVLVAAWAVGLRAAG